MIGASRPSGHRRKPRAARFAAALVPALIVVLAGCRSDSSGPSLQDAFVRLLQADPAAPQAVDLAIDDVVVAQGVEYGSASPKVRTSAGHHRLAIRSGATSVAEYEGNLSAGSTYYVVSSAGSLYLAQASDDGGVSPDTGAYNPIRANIRFVNVPGPDLPPALVTAFLYAPATVDSTQRFGIDTRVASYGPLMYLDPGTITIRFRPTGDSTIVAEAVFDVAAGQIKAVVLERDDSGALHTRVVTEQ
jgi:hypothetical protein